MSNSTCVHTAARSVEREQGVAAAKINAGLDRLIEEMHSLGNVVEAFRELLVERARFKEELCDLPPVPVSPPDPWRFERGVPLTTFEHLIACIDSELWAEGARRLMPVMEKSFPKVGKALEIIRKELLEGRLSPCTVFNAALAGRESEDPTAASRLEISPHLLAFALGQIAKPLVEKLSCTLSPLVEGLSWTKGYCPLCGTMPELAFVDEESGRRWLRCASCSYEWQFTLLVCPFCESRNHDDFEIYFVADREYEIVDVCHQCRRYVPTLDLRKRPKPIAREVAAMALMPLDVIAQEKGFLPAAVCAWDIVRSRDVFSVPVPM